jgi:hypothetical protein
MVLQCEPQSAWKLYMRKVTKRFPQSTFFAPNATGVPDARQDGQERAAASKLASRRI